MAATTRTITDKIYKLDGTVWAGATVTIARVDRPMIDADGTVGDSVVSATTAEDGTATITVAVPPSGAGRYRLTRPVESGQPPDVTYFYMADGDDLTVGEILAGSASALTEDAVLTLMNAYLSKADNLASLASAATARTNLGLGTAATAATGDFDAAGTAAAAVSAHTGTGTGAHVATAISVTPSGNLAATTVQAALEELQGDIDGMGGGASDVGDLTTTGGSSTNMLRVAAAGGLEYRTVAQVLADIGAAPTASPTFTGTVTMAAATVTGNVTVTNTVGFRPASNTTSWPLVQDAAGAAVVTVDTTNKKMIVEQQLDINIGKSLSWGGGQTYTISKGGAGLYFKSWIFPAQFAGVAGVVMNIGTDNGLSTIGHGNTATAAADIAASTTAAASLRLRSGTAPTSPNEGDIWFDGTNLKMYDGTTTRTISWT